MPLRTTTPIPINPKPTEFSSAFLEHAETPLLEHTVTAAAPLEHELGVRRTRQLRSNWCWAACVDMVLDFYGQPEVRQCDVVGKKLNKPCCDDPFNNKYNVTCDEKDIRLVWNSLGIKSRAHLGQLTQDHGWVEAGELMTELKNNHPVQLGLKWNGTGGHAIIVQGWKDSSQGLFFFVNDPWNWAAADVPEIVNGKGRVHYDELRDAYGMGKWTWTWTELDIL
jgi:hypothetical protein